MTLAADDLTNVTAWVNFGVLGLVVLSLITGWLWTKPSVDRLVADRDRVIAERDKAAAQRDAMAQVLQEKLLPVVGDFVTTTRVLLPLLQEFPQLQHMTPLLQELIRSGEASAASPKPAGRARRPPPHQ